MKRRGGEELKRREERREPHLGQAEGELDPLVDVEPDLPCGAQVPGRVYSLDLVNKLILNFHSKDF